MKHKQQKHSFLCISGRVRDRCYTAKTEKIEQNFYLQFCCLAVIIRLLFNAPDALWLWHRIKRFVIVVYFKMAPQRDNWVKFSALYRVGHKASEVANLVGVSHTTIYAINKRMNDGEGQTCSQCSKDCCGLWQLAGCHSRQSQDVHAPTGKETWGWSGDFATSCR